MRVSVFVRLASMGCPSRVGNTNRVSSAGARMFGDQFNAVSLVAVRGVLGHNHVAAILGHCGEAGTVVSAVFEDSEAFDEEVSVVVVVGITAV